MDESIKAVTTASSFRILPPSPFDNLHDLLQHSGCLRREVGCLLFNGAVAVKRQKGIQGRRRFNTCSEQLNKGICVKLRMDFDRAVRLLHDLLKPLNDSATGFDEPPRLEFSAKVGLGTKTPQLRARCPYVFPRWRGGAYLRDFKEVTDCPSPWFPAVLTWKSLLSI